MFRSLEIVKKEGCDTLVIDGVAVFQAKKIMSAKYYGEQCSVAAIYEKDDGHYIAFVVEATGETGKFLQRHLKLDPQPKTDRYAVLEISPKTGLPFAHYNITSDKVCIFTQNGRIGVFLQEEAERLLEHLRKEMWFFYVRKRDE